MLSSGGSKMTRSHDEAFSVEKNQNFSRVVTQSAGRVTRFLGVSSRCSTRGPGHDVSRLSRVKSVRVGRSHGTVRLESGGFEGSRVGSGRVGTDRPALIQPDPTREN